MCQVYSYRRIRSQTSEFKGDNTTVCGDGSERSAGINDHVGAATRTLEAVSSKIAGRSLNSSTGDFVAARIIERQRISWINGAPEHSQRGLRSGKREGDGTSTGGKIISGSGCIGSES